MARPAGQSSLSQFLSCGRARLEQAIRDNVQLKLVVGNESADLDSMVSAVTYAYLQHLQDSAQQTQSEAVIPVVNIPSADLALRPEFMIVLDKASVNLADLVTLDDVFHNNEPRVRPQQTSWVLVDHNKLTGGLAKHFQDRTVGCVDHHEDEGAVPDDAWPRIVQKCGSCTSLVVNLFKDYLNVDDEGYRETQAQVAKVALASIIIDTRNLEDEAKVESVDQGSVALLERVVRGADVAFDRAAYFHEIDEAKSNLDKLSLEQVLRKDYKAWPERLNIGISSSVLSMPDLLRRDPRGTQGFLDIMEQFAEDRKLDLFATMTAYSGNGIFRRELLLSAWGEDAVKAARKFEDECRKELELHRWEGDANLDYEGEGHWLKVWNQRAVQHSRKTVAPLLRRVVND